MKKIFISLIMTIGFVISAFGIICADTPTYLRDGNDFYQWSFDSTNGELSLSPAFVAPDTRTTSLSSIAPDVTTLTLNGIHFSHRSSLGYAYSGDSNYLENIKNINVNSTCSRLGIPSGWKSLEAITFKNNTAKKTVIELKARSSKCALPKITYDKNSTTDYYLDFSRNWGSDPITIPAAYSNDPHITYSFFDSYDLRSVSFESGTKTIPEYAFDSCDRLSEITIPSGVTTIEYGAFYKCESLRSISIPASVKTIRYNSFYKTGIYRIDYEGTRDQWTGLVKTLDSDGKAVEGGNVLYLDNATVYCSDGNVLIKKTYENGHSVYTQIFTGWNQKDGKWYYYKTNGDLARDEMLYIDGSRYGFDSNGVMRTGWYNSGSDWYFFNLKSGKRIEEDWLNDNGKWYYFDYAGRMVTGSHTIDGQQYVFTDSGALYTGWKLENDDWHYYTTKGRVTGWYQIGNNWYYFETQHGDMVKGHQNIGGYWYQFRDSGAMVTGWYQIKDRWYYYNTNGTEVFKWKQIGGKWYYFSESTGIMLSGGIYTLGGKSYKFLDNGVWDETWNG